MESDLEGGSVERAAAAELERLSDLDDATWFDGNRSAMPLWMGATIFAGGVLLLTLYGVWLTRDDSWRPMLGGALGAVAFVLAVSSLERRHHGVALPRRIPVRILRESARRMRGMNVAIMVMVPVFLFAVKAGASWWVIALIVTVGMGAAIGATLPTGTGRFAKAGSQ